MWKVPRKRFKSGNAQDVDDFNEAFYETGSEAGRLGEHNFDQNPFGIGDPNRILNLERDQGFHSDVVTDHDASPGGPALLDVSGWVIADTATFTSREATLRCSARYGVDIVTPANQGAIRIDGVIVYDSRTPLDAGHPSLNIFAVEDVPAGSHVVDLIVQSDGDSASFVENRTLSILVMEK